MLKDMARTPKESKEEAQEALVGYPSKYPYGLCISLDDDTLEKLGMALPAIGAQMRVEAIATVTSLNANQDADGKAANYVSLQITALDVAPLATATDTAKRLYKSQD